MGQIIQNVFTWGTNLPAAGLYSFIFAWLFIESTGFPISDEPLLLLAGYLTTLQRIGFAPAVGIALVGKVAASCLAYWIGTRLDLERLARPDARPARGVERWLYYVRPTKAFALATEERFRRQGAWGVFLGRLIPVVRSFISYPAGAARMPFGLFLLATSAGSLTWIVVWTTLGAVLGKSYQQAAARWGSVSWIVLAAVVVIGVGAWYWNHRRVERATAAAYAKRQAEEGHTRQAEGGVR